MNTKNIKLISRFCNTLRSIAGEMSENRLLWCLANTEKELHELENKTEDAYGLNLLEKMIKEIKHLTTGVERIGFGQYMEDYPKAITAFMHELEERNAKPNKTINEFLREDYEPNPYDGTYSEE